MFADTAAQGTLPPLDRWTRLGATTSGLFASLLPALAREEAADLEPERSSAEWPAWRRRVWDRRVLRSQVLIAGGLTEDPDDPAPLGPEDLAWFISWCDRWLDRIRPAAMGEAA